ncbi:MAG: isochorismate synthase [Flavobacteriales bacterium AspAUS03]
MKKYDLPQLYKAALKAYQAQRKFALFRKPGGDIIELYIHNPDQTSQEDHFLIGSFNHDHTIRICPSKILYAKIPSSSPSSEYKTLKHYWQETPSTEYIRMINAALKQLHTGILKKVVLSRMKKIPFRRLALKTSFQNLLTAHPEGLVNLWYEPKYGLWIGATPELLLRIKNKKLQSEALAGTLSSDISAFTWTFKELEEHHMVLRHITNILQNYSGKISIGKTGSLSTGRIKHLKTMIDFSFSEMPDSHTLLHHLHPTPAVCGLPQKAALNFILNHEDYNRTFYAGYIGPIKKNITELYINLRCAQIHQGEIVLYVGSGITAQSEPEKEWLETEIKAENTLSQLHFR